MTGQLVDPDGVRWWTAAYACTQLDVERARLYDWVRRSKTNHGFPTVDPPRREGNAALYRAEQLLAAERHTAAATRGRRRPT